MTVNLGTTEVLVGDRAVAEGEAKLDGRSFKRAPRDPNYNKHLLEAAQLWGAAMNGSRRAMLDVEEALSTSDFPIFLGALFDRELLAQYDQITPVWQQFARRTVVRDFRPKTWVDLLGGRGILDVVPEATEYPARSVDESKYELRVGKRGARIPLTWEALVNDDLDQFRNLPDRLAAGARDTEDYTATQLLVNASGANTSFFKAGNGNAPTALPLTLDNLSAAIQAVTQRKDTEGRPISTGQNLILMVPSGLVLQAEAILATTEVRTTVGNQTTISTNPIARRVRIVENPWLTVIAQDAKASTRWFLLPDPGAARPALIVGFLRGHETPDLRVKLDAGQRLGGGALAPEEGSFDDDTLQYRVRHVLGSTVLDPIATYVSNGS